MASRDDVGPDPDYRFSLANERTFLAWIRTALGLVAGGVVLLAVLNDLGHPTVRMVVGTALMGLGALVPPLAYRRWAATERALRAGTSLPEPGLLRVVTAGVVIVAVLVAALMLV